MPLYYCNLIYFVYFSCKNSKKIYEKNCEQDNEKREILKGKKVAIIGGGPAGLTSAAFLAKDGVRSYNF